MKAKRVFLQNAEEFTQADRLNLPQKTKPVFTEADFYFPIHAVQLAHMTIEGFICIQIFGREVFLKHEKKVWDKIKLHLE